MGVEERLTDKALLAFGLLNTTPGSFERGLAAVLALLVGALTLHVGGGHKSLFQIRGTLSIQGD